MTRAHPYTSHEAHTHSWRITNTRSGVDLGEWRAADEQGALDAMARDAGYADYAEACRVAPVAEGEISVEREPVPSDNYYSEGRPGGIGGLVVNGFRTEELRDTFVARSGDRPITHDEARAAFAERRIQFTDRLDAGSED